MHVRTILLIAAFSLASPELANAQQENVDREKKAPRAARSVHLGYPAPEGVVFYNEMTVDESVPGSYFMACGFRHGYFGIQELSGDKKVVLFSIWDPGDQNDAKSVPEDRRVEVLEQSKDVRIGRFGGEGTGAQCFLDYAWKKGETYRFLVKASTEKNKTTFSAYFHRNDTKEWTHLATFRSQTGGGLLKGYYSFVEDFRRDGKSPHEQRSARFHNGWVQNSTGDWTALVRAKFTADGTPLENIDAGLREGRFFLTTGGATKNETPLNSTIKGTPPGVGTLP